MPIPGKHGISKSAAGIGEAQHRGAAFPDSELASGVNARRSNPEQWLTICVGELDHRDPSRPDRKASPDYPLSCALTISLRRVGTERRDKNSRCRKDQGVNAPYGPAATGGITNRDRVSPSMSPRISWLCVLLSTVNILCGNSC